MSDLTETLFWWAVILVALAFFIRAVRRHRRKPRLRMWNPFDPAEANPEPGQPIFGPGAIPWLWYVIGFSISATIVHFVAVR